MSPSSWCWSLRSSSCQPPWPTTGRLTFSTPRRDSRILIAATSSFPEDQDLLVLHHVVETEHDLGDAALKAKTGSLGPPDHLGCGRYLRASYRSVADHVGHLRAGLKHTGHLPEIA